MDNYNRLFTLFLMGIRKYYRNFFSEKYHLLITMFLVLILFKEPIEDGWTVYIINPFLSNVNESDYSDVCFLVFSLIIFIYFTPKYFHRYIISYRHILVTNFFLLSYIYIYRENLHSNFIWAHFKQDNFSHIRYADLIIFYGGIINSLFLIDKLIYGLFKSKKTLLEEDNPIISFTEDLLHRRQLSETIAEIIDNTHANRSVAYGVVGEWGAGKTSLMNLVQLSLNKKDLVIEFSPWISFSKNDIIHDFFEILSEKLNSYSSELSTLLKLYAKEISEGNKGFKLVSEITNLLDNTDYNKQAKRIDVLLSKIGRKVVIFIDDLDRVEPKIIIHVMQLIRSSADFKNFIFIVGYDKLYVNKAIENSNIHNAKNYLEKIFFQEFILPAIDSDVLENYVFSKIQKGFPQEQKIIEAALKSSLAHKSIFNDQIIKNIRDAKRFSSVFISSYSNTLINGEVDFSDFFKVEMLRFKFPLVYQLFEINKDEYLAVSEKIVRNEPQYSLAKKTGDGYNIEKVLIENTNDFLLSNKDVNTIIELLVSLFGDADKYITTISKSNLSIVHKRNIHKYFKRRLNRNDLSNKEFTEYYKKDFGVLSQRITEWLDAGKRPNVVDKFKSIDKKNILDKELYKKHIKSLFLIGRYQERNTNPFYTGYDWEDIFDKMSWDKFTQKVFSDKKSDFEEFAMEIFSSSKYPYYFDSNFLDHVSGHFNVDSFILSKDDIDNLRVSYLEQFCSKNSFFSHDVWTLMHNCELINWDSTGSGSWTKRTERNPKALNVVLEYAKKYPDTFIPEIVSYYHEDQKTISSIVKDLFGSYDDFKKFIGDSSLDGKSYITDIRGLYKALETAGFDKYVDFTFNVLQNRRGESRHLFSSHDLDK